MSFNVGKARLTWTAAAIATLAATVLLAGAVQARPITWARTGDALTLDPHSQNEGPTHNLMQQIYEPLILRESTGKLLPTLALSWMTVPATIVFPVIGLWLASWMSVVVVVLA